MTDISETMCEPAPRIGDMVVTRNGTIGLLINMTPNNRAVVQGAQNGPIHHFRLHNVRRATHDEVQASHLHGVGCNQAHDHVPESKS